ncbi:MAG: site-specific DNA-methyltransferase [Candidatus Fimisoma sp.]
MPNLSQIKRERMMAFLQKIKDEYRDDDEMLIALGEIESELNAKKYGLVWEQHEEAVDVMMQDNIPVFTEVPEKEIVAAPGEGFNFILEGDNLHSLHLLEKTHKGKIDMIYIDPPYNLGGDFVYNDDYVGKEDGFRHSKWLSFMEARLKIAYRLLSDKGAIFISINDSEYATLKLLCDDIFSELNYQITFIWKSRQRADSRNVNMLSTDHEYVLVYSKTNQFTVVGKEKDISKYSNPDNDPRGPWASIDLSGLADASRRPNLHYDIVNPETGISYPPNPNRGWSKSRETVARMISENRILWPSSPKGRPREKKFLKDLLSDRTGFSSVLESDDVGFTTDGTRALINVLGNRAFSFPKSVKLLKTLIGQFPDENCIVLDFFAGSGTTAQAVLELNNDGGNRHFIICTNNENDICESVTYPRVKSIITGIRPDGSKCSDGTPANVKLYRTGFVSKDEEYLSDALLEHIAEMVQLEHGVKIDGSQYLMIMSDEEADELQAHWNEYDDVKALYVSRNVLFTTEQNRLFANAEIHIIPDYYFNFELKEVGETW